MIHLVQLLCPSRHCVIAAFYDDARGGNLDDTKRIMAARMNELGVDNYCGICGSMMLTWEDRQTKFPDMKTAMQVGLVCEADNIATRQFLDATGQSFKAKQRN